MLSLSIAIAKFMSILMWIHLKVGVTASLCGAVSLIHSNVLKLSKRAEFGCVLPITLFGEKNGHFCFHHVKDKVNIDLEQLLTQITMVHCHLCILLYSATYAYTVLAINHD